MTATAPGNRLMLAFIYMQVTVTNGAVMWHGIPCFLHDSANA